MSLNTVINLLFDFNAGWDYAWGSVTSNGMFSSLHLPSIDKFCYSLLCSVYLIFWNIQLQTTNIRQASSQPVQPLLQNAQILSGLPPLPQNKIQLGLMPSAQDSRVSAGVPNQYNTLQKFITQTQIQHAPLNQNQALQQAQLIAQFGVSSHPTMHPLSLSGLSVGQQMSVPTSSLNQQMQHPTSQKIGPVLSSNPRYNAVPRSQTDATDASVLGNPQFSATGIQVQNFTWSDNRGIGKSTYLCLVLLSIAHVCSNCFSQRICFSSQSNITWH